MSDGARLKETWTEYSAESAWRRPWSLVTDAWRDLGRGRELALRFFLRDLAAQHRQAFLGYLWLILPPLVSAGIFIALNRQQVLAFTPRDVSYPVFVLSGVLLWELFVSSFLAPLELSTQSAPLIAKIRFPREAIILGGFYQVMFQFLVRLAVVGIALCAFGLRPHWGWMLFPLGCVAISLLGFLLGVALAPIGLLYKDVARGVTTALMIWFFATPVVYAAPASGGLVWIIACNPVAPLLGQTRDWLTIGPGASNAAFWLIFIASAVLMQIAWIASRLALPHVLARLSA